MPDLPQLFEYLSTSFTDLNRSFSFFSSAAFESSLGLPFLLVSPYSLCSAWFGPLNLLFLSPLYLIVIIISNQASLNRSASLKPSHKYFRAPSKFHRQTYRVVNQMCKTRLQLPSRATAARV